MTKKRETASKAEIFHFSNFEMFKQMGLSIEMETQNQSELELRRKKTERRGSLQNQKKNKKNSSSLFFLSSFSLLSLSLSTQLLRKTGCASCSTLRKRSFSLKSFSLLAECYIYIYIF
jgi:hypothetical protein